MPADREEPNPHAVTVRPALSWAATFAVVAIILVAFAARLWHLQFQSTWWDEGVAVYLTTVGVRGLTVAKDFSVDLHLPGYYLLLTIWRLLFGPTVFAFRLFSVFAGTITVPVVYAFTRRLVGPDLTPPPLPGAGRGAERPAHESPSFPPSLGGKEDPGKGSPGLGPTVAALLAALSPIAVFYSQEIRMYPLLPALGGVSLLTTLNVLERGKRRDWIVWALVASASLYVYYYFGLLVAAEALTLIAVWRRGQLLPWLGAQAAVLVALVPWLIVMASRLGRSDLALPPETEVHLTPLRYLALNGIDFTLGFELPPRSTLILALWAIAAVVGLVALGWRHPWRLALLLAAVAVPLLGAYAVLLNRPFFYPRFILFALVPLWAVVAIGLTAHRRALPLGLLALAAILAGNLWTWHVERVTPRSGYAPDDFRTVFASIAPRVRPGDVIVGGYPWQAGYVDAYLGALGAHGAFQPGPLNASRLAGLAEPNGRVWLDTYAPNGAFDRGEIDRLVGPNARIAFLDQYGDTRMALFTYGVDPSMVGVSTPGPAGLASFGQQILLTTAAVSPQTARPGDTIQVALRWRALTHPTGAYTVFVHLLGPDGKLVAQHDGPPVGGSAPTDHWSPGEVVVDRVALAVPPGAPPGRYQLEAGLYRPDNGQRLVVSPSHPDNRVIIGGVEVRY